MSKCEICGMPSNHCNSNVQVHGLRDRIAKLEAWAFPGGVPDGEPPTVERTPAAAGPVPPGYKLAPGWSFADPEKCACTHSSGIKWDCKQDALFVNDAGACAAHAIEMGAIVKVDPPAEPSGDSGELPQWTCACGYMNAGPVCTKCGRPPAERPVGDAENGSCHYGHCAGTEDGECSRPPAPDQGAPAELKVRCHEKQTTADTRSEGTASLHQQSGQGSREMANVDAREARPEAQGAPAEPLRCWCGDVLSNGLLCGRHGGPQHPRDDWWIVAYGNYLPEREEAIARIKARLAISERERDEAVLLLRPHRFGFHGVDDFLNRHDAAARAIREGRPAPK